MYKVSGQQSLPLSKNRRGTLGTIKAVERILLALERKCDTKHNSPQKPRTGQFFIISEGFRRKYATEG